MKKPFLFMLLFLALAVCWRCLLFVDETQFVIVTQFGRPVQTLTEAGLYFKQPYQSSLPIDRRIQIYNPPPSEFLTSEKKNVDLDVFVCWRVEAPQQFLETVNDPKSHRLEGLVQEVAAQCADEVRQKYGIALLDVKVKRIGLPEQVRESVFERMRKERARIAERYRSEGKEEALKIKAAADKEKTIILAKAYANSEILRGRAEAQATRVYSEAHQKDPRFFELMRTLETYKKILDEKTTILLSGDSELLKYLTRGPAAGAPQPAAERK